jgi:hypothetical protein
MGQLEHFVLFRPSLYITTSKLLRLLPFWPFFLH